MRRSSSVVAPHIRSPRVHRTLACLLLLSVLLACTAVRAARTGEPDSALVARYLGAGEWVVAGDGAIRVWAARGWQREAEQAVGAARRSLHRIAAALGAPVEDVLPLWIVLSPGGGGFALESPSWSAAIARPGQHLIVLSGPALASGQASLPETVAHEIVHLAVHERIGDEAWMPLWLHEGLAVHFSAARRLRERFLTWGRGPIHLGELESVFPQHPTRAHLAYLESHAAVQRLLRQGPIAPLLDRIAAGEEFADAFHAVYGMSPPSFAQLLHGEVARSTRHLTLLTSSATLFGLMTLLFVVAGLRKRQRDRRRRREWEAQEAALQLLPESASAASRSDSLADSGRADAAGSGASGAGV